jgi:hypothetical protein
LIVERLFAGPFLADDVQILAGAGVALVLGQVVAVLGQLVVRAAGDDVHGNAAAGELVQRGQLAGRDCGGGEAGAVGDHEAQALGYRRGMRDDQLAFRRGRAEGDQGAVEAAFIVGDGDALDIVTVDHRALGGVDLGLVLGADDADEFDGHGRLRSWVGENLRMRAV